MLFVVPRNLYPLVIPSGAEPAGRQIYNNP